MRNFEVKPFLKGKLKKLFKKDKILYETVMSKIEEVVRVTNVTHYKNLKYELKEFKRVHVKTHFVLLFLHNPADDSVSFCDVEHHDVVYETNKKKLKKYKSKVLID